MATLMTETCQDNELCAIMRGTLEMEVTQGMPGLYEMRKDDTESCIGKEI